MPVGLFVSPGRVGALVTGASVGRLLGCPEGCPDGRLDG